MPDAPEQVFYSECYTLCWPDPGKTVIWRDGKGRCQRCGARYDKFHDPFNEKAK